MILEGLLTILQSLVGWLFLVIFQMLLRIVDILERFFDVFAGTAPVYYKGKENYLFDLFLSNQAITNLFWAMAIIAIVISFGFCIVAVARKVTDVSGTSKHTIGQIMSNFIRSLLVILLLNLCVTAAFKVTSVIFDRINYSLEHAESMRDEQEKTYTEEEFATMVRILATMGNYAANPSAESRYNVNACFNAIRGELITLYEAGCFNYDFPVVQTGKHTWQSALAQVAKSADLNEDLQLDTYYPTVQDAVTLCFNELKTNSTFKPQETAVRGTTITEKLTTAMMIFLVSSMGAEENEQFINGGFDDALRRSYINGEKDYLSFDDVFEDFAITQINYLIGIIAALACILFLAKIILMFIVRMLNLILLYVVSPLFASSMSLDEGSRFQNWTQSFVMQLLSAYASVVMMRIYLLVVPIVVNSDLKFFEPGTYASHLTIYGQLLFVLAGAWAVYKANGLIAGALTGNAAGAVQEADSALGHMVSWAIGTDRLWSELGRRRMNKDRAKSHARGQFDKSLRPEGAVNESAQAMKDLKEAITESRDNKRSTESDKHSGGSDKHYSRDDSSIDTSGTSGLDQMRKDFRIDKDPGASKGFNDAENINSVRAGSHLDSMRSSMGLDNPYAPESFNLDELPDLGKQTGAPKGNTVDNGSGTKGTTNITGTNSTTGTGRRSNTRTSTAGSQTGGGRKRRASVYTNTFSPKPPAASVQTNPTTTVNTTGTTTAPVTGTVNTGNVDTRGNVGMTENTGRDGRRGTDGINGRDSINNTTQEAANLTRDRGLNNQNTTVANNPADMKANLKSKLSERQNQ